MSDTRTPIPLELEKWLPCPDDLLIIAGPCSVESWEQLITTAKQIAACGRVQVLRAGVWKPRSQPGHFEGRGESALPWLNEIKEQTGLLAAVEVAQPRHVELCLKNNIDIIWLGARTSVNPFMVQEIADTIKGTKIPVMIKNPVCPDLRLWIGAIERIMLAGTEKVIAIHRGFQSHQKSLYRNLPLWNIPLALKKEMPHLPIICDPSHIAGNKELLTDIASKALAFNMNGLMIEVHNKPEKALTDPLQQISPDLLIKLLDEVIEKKNTENPEQKLNALRQLIDEIDHEMLDALSNRMIAIKEIGKLKRLTNADILQPERQKKLFADRLKRAREIGLNAVFINQLLQLLHKESVTIQSTSR